MIVLHRVGERSWTGIAPAGYAGIVMWKSFISAGSDMRVFVFVVRNHLVAGCMHAFIAVDMIDMPMGIDQRMRRIAAHSGDRFLDVRNGTLRSWSR